MYPVALFNESSFPKTFYGFSHVRSVGVCESVLMCVCVCVCPGTLAARMQMWKEAVAGGRRQGGSNVRCQTAVDSMFICLPQTPAEKRQKFTKISPTHRLFKNHI